MKIKSTGTIPKKIIIWIASILILLVVGFFIWQKKKYRIADQKLKSTLYEKTDGLYRIYYDSLHFDELSGYVKFENVSLIPDTNKFLGLPIEKRPMVLIEMKAKEIVVTGIKALTALGGKELIGDSIRIESPKMLIYNLKPFVKETKIETEAKEIYEEILGKMDLIRVKNIVIKNLNLTAIDFLTKNKNLDIVNGQIRINDILIDSAHNADTNRVLFSKQFDFAFDSLIAYNENRKELIAQNVIFDGRQEYLSIGQFLLFQFQNKQDKGKEKLLARQINFRGLHSDQIVKHKNFAVDSVLCDDIVFYQPGAKANPPKMKDTASSGFLKVYSVDLKKLLFNNIKWISDSKSKYEIGKVHFHISDLQSGSLQAVIAHPFDFSKELIAGVDKISFQSKDKKYTFKLSNAEINSRTHRLEIGSFNVIPYKSEIAFAKAERFQKDRYDVSMSGIQLQGIEMNELLSEKLLAKQLSISKINARIYRDLTKPLEEKSKVGNYPSQLIMKMEFPLSIAKIKIRNAFIQYREKQIKSDSVGTVTFPNTIFDIKNITNLPSEIKRNNRLAINFHSKILGVAPIKGSFNFFINNPNGKFTVNANISEFDATKLNQISIPMALIEVKSGRINSAEFNFTGSNTKASGEMTMKYEDLKVNVLKIDKDSKDVKKRGLASFFANLIVLNDNPQGGNLRKVHPEYDRDIYKSFFNLVWKTFFTGLKETVGLP